MANGVGLSTGLSLYGYDLVQEYQVAQVSERASLEDNPQAENI